MNNSINSSVIIPQKIKGEGDSEYKGLISVINKMHRKPGNFESDKAAAEKSAKEFVGFDARSHQALNNFLEHALTLYVSSRASGKFDALINDLNGGAMPKGVNNKTSPISKVIKGLLGKKYQGDDKRALVSNWAKCLSILLEEKISHDKVAATISDRGGYGKIIAKLPPTPSKGGTAKPDDAGASEDDNLTEDNDGDDQDDSNGKLKPDNKSLAAAPFPTVKSGCMTYSANASPKVRAAIKTANAQRTPDAVAHLKFLGGGKVDICMAAFRTDAQKIVEHIITRMSKKAQENDDLEND